MRPSSNFKRQTSNCAGHADPSVTLAIYAHVMGDGGLDGALRVLDQRADRAGDRAGETASAGSAQREGDPVE